MLIGLVAMFTIMRTPVVQRVVQDLANRVLGQVNLAFARQSWSAMFLASKRNLESLRGGVRSASESSAQQRERMQKSLCAADHLEKR